MKEDCGRERGGGAWCPLFSFSPTMPFSSLLIRIRQAKSEGIELGWLKRRIRRKREVEKEIISRAKCVSESYFADSLDSFWLE